MKEMLKAHARVIGRDILHTALRTATTRAVGWAHRAIEEQYYAASSGDYSIEVPGYRLFGFCSELLDKKGAFEDAEAQVAHSVYVNGHERHFYSPGEGTYPTRYEGGLIKATILKREFEEHSDNYSVILRSKDKGLLKRFIDEAVELGRKRSREEDRIGVLRARSSGWSDPKYVPPRDLSTVILKEGLKEKLTGHVERFESSRERYSRLGVPYRTGILLSGPPGTGKTTLVRALASEYNRDIYIAELSAMNDSTFQKAIRDVPPGHIVLFEDVDAAKAAEDRDKKEPAGDDIMPGLTLKGLLNGIDGVESPEDTIFMMTTNRPEELDPALVRPGRVDLKAHLEAATESQRRRMYLHFFPGQTDRAEEYATKDTDGPETPARIQTELLALSQE